MKLWYRYHNFELLDKWKHQNEQNLLKTILILPKCWSSYRNFLTIRSAKRSQVSTMMLHHIPTIKFRESVIGALVQSITVLKLIDAKCQPEAIAIWETVHQRIQELRKTYNHILVVSFFSRVIYCAVDCHSDYWHRREEMLHNPSDKHRNSR